MPFTPNYGLEQPLGSDNYNVAVFNANASIVDEQMKRNENTATAAAVTWEIPATLTASGWSANAPYQQTIAAPGITTDMPRQLVDLVVTDTDNDIALDEIEAWSYIGRIDQGNDTITAVCYADKPTVDLNLTIKVVV